MALFGLGIDCKIIKDKESRINCTINALMGRLYNQNVHCQCDRPNQIQTCSRSTFMKNFEPCRFRQNCSIVAHCAIYLRFAFTMICRVKYHMSKSWTSMKSSLQGPMMIRVYVHRCKTKNEGFPLIQ